MKNVILMLVTAMTIVACGKDDNSTVVEQSSVTTVTTTNHDVQTLVDEFNESRIVQGLAPVTPGLSCTVQQIASGTWLSSSSVGYPGSGLIVLTGSSYGFLFQDTFDEPSNTGPETMLPLALQPQFSSLNYKIQCTGYMVVTNPGYNTFDVNSDDGSILTVSSVQVVNNDNSHGMVDKSGVLYLNEGVVAFSLLYSQSGLGPHGLVIHMNGSDVDSATLYH